MKVTVTMEFESMEAAAAFLLPKPVAVPAQVEEPTAKATKKRAGNKVAEVVAEAQAAAPAAVEAVKHTLEHVQTALESVFSKHGLQTARDLLARFGVQRAKDLKPEQYSGFVEHAGKVAETGVV